MSADKIQITCTKCNQSKPEIAFYFHKKQNRYRHWCKDCCNVANKSWYSRNKTSVLNSTYKNTYGITSKEVESLYKNQNELCAICNTKISVEMNSQDARAFVDHDHTTGKVRGLLCRKCNTGIGMLKDSISILEAAIDYLKNAR